MTDTTDAQAAIRINESTDRARTESLLTPRFYTTDFDELELRLLNPFPFPVRVRG